ncbi:SusE domain-containing protein [Flavobacterium sp. GT2N3]|uniref:SusE domain-containing protein n=1 Tax=unclassified Flavobacterium TaxID=196869 RepID=UPI003AB0C543
MKNLNKILIAFIAIVVASCTADAVDNRPVIESISTPEVITPENNRAFVLTEANAENVTDRFTWTEAKYSNDVVVQYTLMIDKKGGDFTKAKVVATTSDINQLTVLVKNLNQVAIDLGAVPGEATVFDIKVKSSVSGSVVMVSKTPVTISINTYSGLLAYDFTDWYLIGDAVEGKWENNATTKHQPLFRSGTNPNLYQFTGLFKAGAFKLISTPGKWAPLYGKGDNGVIVARPSEADPDPASFEIVTEGYYTFTMNTETLKYTLVAYNATAAKTFTTVGIIGDSTPLKWDASTALTQSTFNSHVWSLDLLPLNDGKAKFRANNAWDVSWGGDTAFSGFPNNGASGGDLPVAKSKYRIYFNDLDGSYLMIPNQE